jgi:hypothetical protein
LERQIEVEKEERMALQRTNQELSSGISERATTELQAARAQAAAVAAERDVVRADLRRLEARVAELQDDCSKAAAAAETARAQHLHYKVIINSSTDFLRLLTIFRQLCIIFLTVTI